jgi:Methyltransferase domain
MGMGSDDIHCNLCGGVLFSDIKSRKNAKCAECGSLERTRLLWMYLERLKLTGETRVLHMAPEPGLYRALERRLQPAEPSSYICADIDPDRFKFVKNMARLDLCDLDDQPSNQYDVIIHSHVMEHVTCNIAYTLFHLHRMLKPEGHHVCVIPFRPGCYDECFQQIGRRERIRRFGQHDHVRRFGVEDVNRHLGALLKLPSTFDAREKFGEESLRRANIPEAAWCGFTINTVLTLKKYDMKLLSRSGRENYRPRISACGYEIGEH